MHSLSRLTKYSNLGQGSALVKTSATFSFDGTYCRAVTTVAVVVFVVLFKS